MSSHRVDPWEPRKETRGRKPGPVMCGPKRKRGRPALPKRPKQKHGRPVKTDSTNPRYEYFRERYLASKASG